MKVRIFVAGLVLANAPSWTHHASTTDFDVSTLIVLQGKVKKVEWINPPAWLHLDVKDPDGKVTVWRIEGASSQALTVRKFPKEV